MTKFIKLTTESGNEHYLNPIFITHIKKVKSLNEAQPDTVTIYTLNGGNIQPKESVDEIMKKIKDIEKFIITNQEK